MKKALVVAVAVLLAAGGSVVTAGAEAADKIGYVDLARVFDEYQKTKDLDKALEAKGAEKQAERDKMVADIKKLRDEAELASAKAKEEKQAKIDEKIKTLQEFDRSTRDALRKERDSMVRDILKEVETVIQNHGKTQGYTYILNDRVLLFKSEQSDLTQPIVKGLNDAYATKKK